MSNEAGRPAACPECRALTERCGSLERVYAAALGEINSMTMAGEPDRNILLAADGARLQLEIARFELEKHWRTHAPPDLPEA